MTRTPNNYIISTDSFAKPHKRDACASKGRDNFPSTEAFITDPNGNNVFIGIGQIAKDVDKNTGPFTELSGENKRDITSFSFGITTDSCGNFINVQYNGKDYSISDWNKRFTSQSF